MAKPFPLWIDGFDAEILLGHCGSILEDLHLDKVDRELFQDLYAQCWNIIYAPVPGITDGGEI